MRTPPPGSQRRRIATINLRLFLGQAQVVARISADDPERIAGLLRIAFAPRDFELTATDGAMRVARYSTAPHLLLPYRFVVNPDAILALAEDKAWAEKSSAQILTDKAGLSLTLTAGPLTTDLRTRMARFPDYWQELAMIRDSRLVAPRDELLLAVSRDSKDELVRLYVAPQGLAVRSGALMGSTAPPQIVTAHLFRPGFNIVFNRQHLKEALFNIEDEDVRFERGKLVASRPVMLTGRTNDKLQYLLTPVFDDSEEPSG